MFIQKYHSVLIEILGGPREKLLAAAPLEVALKALIFPLHAKAGIMIFFFGNSSFHGKDIFTLIFHCHFLRNIKLKLRQSWRFSSNLAQCQEKSGHTLA